MNQTCTWRAQLTLAPIKVPSSLRELIGDRLCPLGEYKQRKVIIMDTTSPGLGEL